MPCVFQMLPPVCLLFNCEKTICLCIAVIPLFLADKFCVLLQISSVGISTLCFNYINPDKVCQCCNKHSS